MGWENSSNFTVGSVLPEVEFGKVQHNVTGLTP